MSGEIIKWSALLPDQRDALVHEKVMGQSLLCDAQLLVSRCENPRISMAFSVWHCPICDYVGSGNNSPIANLHPNKRPVPCYTTSLDAAWLIVEHFDELVLVVHVKPRWHCTLHKDEAPSGDAVMNTPQEAICVASLRASGVEIDTKEEAG